MPDDPEKEPEEQTLEELNEQLAAVEERNKQSTVTRESLKTLWKSKVLQESNNVATALRDVVDQSCRRVDELDQQMLGVYERYSKLVLLQAMHNQGSVADELAEKEIVRLKIEIERPKFERIAIVDVLNYFRVKSIVEGIEFPSVSLKYLDRSWDPSSRVKDDYSGHESTEELRNGRDGMEARHFLEFSDNYHRAQYQGETFRFNDNQAAFVRELSEVPDGEFKHWREIFEKIDIDPHDTNFTHPYQLFKRGSKSAFEFYRLFIEHDQGRYRLKSLP